jgi:hypothetical protein
LRTEAEFSFSLGFFSEEKDREFSLEFFTWRLALKAALEALDAFF